MESPRAIENLDMFLTSLLLQQAGTMLEDATPRTFGRIKSVLRAATTDRETDLVASPASSSSSTSSSSSSSHSKEITKGRFKAPLTL